MHNFECLNRFSFSVIPFVFENVFSTQRECKFFIFMCENFFIERDREKFCFAAAALRQTDLIAFRSSKLHSFSHAELAERWKEFTCTFDISCTKCL